MPDGTTVMVETEKLIVGVVTGVHGVRGIVRVKSFTENPMDLTSYGPLTDTTGRTVYDLDVQGQSKGQLLVRIAGIADRDAALALKGTELHIDRSALPQPKDEDEFYHADLIGLACVTTDGTEVGRVKALFDFGAGEMIEVSQPGNGSIFIPFTQEAVPEIDMNAGRIVINPPQDVEVDADTDAVLEETNGEGGAA